MDKQKTDIKEIIDKINSKNQEQTPSLESYEFEMGDRSLYEENTASPAAKAGNAEDKADVSPAPSDSEDDYTADTPRGIFKAYVPRFTEASEHYRMADDPRRNFGRPKTARGPQQDKKNLSDSELDPTAELEESEGDAVIVSRSSVIVDEDADRLNVFKFTEDETEKQPPAVRTVKDEREEINRLISRDAEPQAEEPEIPSEPEEPLKREEKKDYVLPDPDSGINVIDFDEGDESSGIIPDGVSDYVPDKKKSLVKEFELPIQRDRIKDRFLDAIMACRIRFGAVCLFALLILGFELCSFYDIFPLSDLSVFAFSGTTLIIDLLLSVSLLLLALPETVSSFKALTNKKLISDISVPVSFLVLSLYTIGILLSRKFSYPLYGFLFSLAPLFSVYGTLCKLNADFSAFKLISGNGEKQILEKKNTRSLPEENYALDGLVDEYKSRTARIFRAAFITDFYKRTGAVSEKSAHTGLILSVSAGVALVVGAVCYFIADGLFSAFSAFSLVFLIGTPAFFLLSHKRLYKDAEEAAVTDDSAALGESAFLEFSETDVICFEDTDIFGIDDVNLKRFMLYGDRDNMENVMRKMCSLFSVVGGPLYYIFAGALDNRVRHNPAVNTVIEADGISGEVSGKLISAGSEEYMIRHGIAIPEGASVNERKNDTIKIMYAAEGKEVYAKFYIRYSFSEEFTMLLPSLKEQGIIPLIYTSDPNISNDLLKRLTAGGDSMRVMKRFTPGTTDEKLHNRVSAGMITVGDKINAINLILLSKKYSRFAERVSASEISAMVIGLVGSTVIALLGIYDIPMALLGAWQLLWCAVLLFSSKNRFLKEKKTEKNQNSND